MFEIKKEHVKVNKTETFDYQTIGSLVKLTPKFASSAHVSVEGLECL